MAAINAIKRWNFIDEGIFRIERKIRNFPWNDLKDEVDAETMIEAKTQYLQEENEHLKQRELPIYLLEEEETLLCPKCRTILTEDVKYCSCCGHRVMKHISLETAF